MNSEYLSDRLKKLASFVNKGAKVADIGSDHAYLPIYLVREGIAVSAIAGEVNKGPFQSAKNQIESQQLQEKIKAKLGNGLVVLEGEDVDTVTIAGMGGPLIAQILEEGKGLLHDVGQLILQPNIAAEQIRRWLIENSWELVAEDIVEEAGHIYEILVAKKGDPYAPYTKENLAKELWLGPLLLKEKDKHFIKKWERESAQLEKIADQLEKAQSSSHTIKKRRDIEEKLAWLEEELG